ncbi:3-methylfumaryl-CoA hydratase [Jannaschia pohangensis]|uniref:3-methylfumaryl-CoA hydratase n=2 Tax=Jannaschia pohangensis TaxID=390807 RepID=A0A1I3MQZ4_9RHOB|nr:3-methylfumaryl-CoA hydratase [Jannaschia pohangensis]
MDPARAAAMAAALNRAAPSGDLPPFWHHAYFWDIQPADHLGRDGHFRTGTGLIPDLGLPRRMWAGGRLEWHASLVTGTPATRLTTLGPVTRKSGRSGALGLVTLHHRITQGDRLCLTEDQSLVYREDPQPGAPRPVPAQADSAPVEETRSFGAMALFRYSAVTFNGHRIHYDAAYARDVEGHAGLVVHGPILAEGLIDLATRHLGPLAGFDYRALAPVVADETVTFCLAGHRAFVRGSDGRLCMDATVRPAT